MLKKETLDSKIIYILGDSHALAFKNKMLSFSDYKINFLPKLMYIRGLSIENILSGQNLRIEISNFLLASNLVAIDNKPACMTNIRGLLIEQYSTGYGFSNQNILFHCGELYVREYLKRLVKETSHLELTDGLKNKLNTAFSKIINLYLNILDNFSRQFQMNVSIHDLCPPPSSDENFFNLNLFLIPKEIRSFSYGLFNDLLEKYSLQFSNIFLCKSRDYLEGSDGFLNQEYEYDSCHADPKYAVISLERIAINWLQSRTAERSNRYDSWFQKTFDVSKDNADIPISKIGITKPKKMFNKEEVKVLINETFNYESQLSKSPTLDWASLPIFQRSSISQNIQIGSINKKGLEIIYNKFFIGENYEYIKKLIKSDFSIINVRPTISKPHKDDGVGLQKFHLGHCPPAIFRGIVYLVDVGEDDGAFEYFPVGETLISNKATGNAGDFFLFDGNAIQHRGSPPGNKTRIALDLIILAHTDDIKNIVNTNPTTTWPVDPYLFSVNSNCIPKRNKNRWFEFSNFQNNESHNNKIAAE